MTISTTSNRKEYTGNGSTTIFPYDFLIFADSDLKVYVDSVLKTLDSDYTVSGEGEPTGGNVTFTVAPASGTSVVIWRDVPKTQSVDYVGGEKFSAETHERALDRLTVISQQLQDDMDRCIKLAKTVTDAGNVEMDHDATARASKYFGFDASGELTIAQALGTWRGLWATSTAYNVGDMVYDGANGADTQSVYYCATSHTSGVWATDLGAAKWTLAIDVETVITDAEAAQAAAEAAQAAAEAAQAAAETAETNAETAETNAEAAEANAITQASNAATSASNAATSESNASDSEDAALASEGMAEEWAENPEDVAITGNPGKYSALHWAAKAAVDNPADALHKSTAGEINSLTAKTTPADADLVVIEDSAASYAKKKMTVSDFYEGKVPTIIDSDLSFYVNPTSGNDSTGTGSAGAPWKTMTPFQTWMKDKWIHEDHIVVVYLTTGKHSISSTFYTSTGHPCEEQVRIWGQAASKTLSSIVSYTGSAGAWTVVLQLGSGDCSNITTNSFCKIRGEQISGGTRKELIIGCHEITNVNTGSDQITIAVKQLDTLTASGAVTGTIIILFSALVQDTTTTIQVDNGNILKMDYLVLMQASYAKTVIGIYAVNGSIVILGTSMGIIGHSYGIYCVNRSMVQASYTTISACSTGMGAITGSTIGANYACISGCNIGFSSDYQGVIYCVLAWGVGNNYGFYAVRRGFVDANSSKCYSTVYTGYHASQFGFNFVASATVGNNSLDYNPAVDTAGTEYGYNDT